MSYLKDREIWLSSVPTGNPPAGYVWVFIQDGVFVVRDSNGVDKIMASTTGTVTNATSASYVEYSNVADKPALISGSSQVSYTGLSDIPSGIVSSSVQVGEYGVFATTGSNQFDGSQAITGSLTVTGEVVAQTLNVQQVTSSIVYSSGSNVFGNDLGNTQQFTGSVSVTGSLAVAGAGTFASNITATGGLISNGGSIGYGGGELGFETTTSGATSGIYTLATGSPILYFDHRATSNTGFWVWRSGTGGGTTALTLSNAGAATFSSSVGVGGSISGNYPLTIRSSAADYTKILDWGTSVGGSWGTMSINVAAPYNTIFNSGGFAFTGGNVGIGTDNPARTLHVMGQGAFDMDTTGIVIQEQGGTAQIVSYKQTGATYADLHLRGANLGIVINGSNGNVGIGTTSPSSKLDIRGSGTLLSTISSNSTNGASVFYAINDSSKSGELGVWGSTRNAFGAISANNGYVFSNDDLAIGATLNIKFGTDGSNTERMRIASNGNVGIGTTSPSYKLHISGSSAGLNFSGGNNRIYFNGYRALEASEDGVTLQLGEGYNQSLVYNKLLVNRTSGDKTFMAKTAATSSGVHYVAGFGGNNYLSGYAIGIGLDPEGYDGRHKIGIVAEGISNGWSRGKLHFLIRNDGENGGEADLSHSRMTINENGNVGIGITSPSEKLHIYNGSGNGPEIRLQNSTTSYYLRAYTDRLNVLAFDGSSTYRETLTIKASNGLVGINEGNPQKQLDVNGNVRITNSTMLGSNIGLLQFVQDGARFNHYGYSYAHIKTSILKGADTMISFNIRGYYYAPNTIDTDVAFYCYNPVSYVYGVTRHDKAYSAFSIALYYSSDNYVCIVVGGLGTYGGFVLNWINTSLITHGGEISTLAWVQTNSTDPAY